MFYWKVLPVKPKYYYTSFFIFNNNRKGMRKRTTVRNRNGIKDVMGNEVGIEKHILNQQR